MKVILWISNHVQLLPSLVSLGGQILLSYIDSRVCSSGSLFFCVMVFFYSILEWKWNEGMFLLIAYWKWKEFMRILLLPGFTGNGIAQLTLLWVHHCGCFCCLHSWCWTLSCCFPIFNHSLQAGLRRCWHVSSYNIVISCSRQRGRFVDFFL